MHIRLKRIYEEAADDDGYRVLVDRIWPRGVAKKDAKLDAWPKERNPRAGCAAGSVTTASAGMSSVQRIEPSSMRGMASRSRNCVNMPVTAG